MDSEQAAILVKDLETRGENVQVFRGDAAVKDNVEKAVGSIPADRHICGVVNAAMALRVSEILLSSQNVASESSGVFCVIFRSC